MRTAPVRNRAAESEAPLRPHFNTPPPKCLPPRIKPVAVSRYFEEEPLLPVVSLELLPEELLLPGELLLPELLG